MEARPSAGECRLRELVAVLCLAGGVFVAPAARAQSPGDFSTLTTSGPNTLGGTTTLNGDALACSGRPWLDVRCFGAKGDDATDDTAALTDAINAAIANNWVLHIPAGTYKITGKLTIDYAGIASSGFHLISEGARIDGRSIASGPVLQIECGGGTATSPTNCFYFREEGALFVDADTPGYAVVFGKADFSDAHNSAKIDHLVVNNASTDAAAGGLQLNYVLDSDIYAIADSAGGAAGIALEQTQFSRISGAGSAAGTGGAAMRLEQGYNFSNTIFGFDFENAPTCLAITFPHDGLNTFVSPYFDCTTAVSATASTGNVLINPNYAGNVVNRGPQATGIRVVGNGSHSSWQFPTAASYTASGVDEGTVLSSYNAPGASLSVTLPAPSAVGAGWWMGFATDNGKGLSVSPASGLILSGGKSVSSVTLAGQDYEYLQLQSDGSNYRVVAATRATRLANGFDAPPWPSHWLYPASAGYAATAADNGNVLSSYDTTSGLTVTLPPTTNLPNGWSIGFATDNGKSLSVQTNAGSGGHILYPGSGNTMTSATMAGDDYEFMALQYDGSGNFRIIDATPATRVALGTLGSTPGISRWSFPATSAYSATAADGGAGISAYNSPTSYMAVTLPATGTINPGWTIGLASDNGKTMSVQVDGGTGEHILYPGSGATVTSLSLAAGDYEYLVLQYDGSNFRVVAATPATAGAIGMNGADIGLNRWSFPAVDSYAAGLADNGNVVSSYNSSAGLSVTLPSTTAIKPGWLMGFASDNGKTLSIAVNATSGGQILYPAGATGTAGSTITLAPGNYEFVALQYDGSNFRIVSITPRTAAALGMLGHQVFTGATPSLGSGSSDCGTAPSIGGNDSLGRLTVGSSTNGGQCTITFAQAWPNPPVCSSFDETSGTLVRPSATTTSVVLSGTLNAGDSIVYRCAGYQ